MSQNSPNYLQIKRLSTSFLYFLEEVISKYSKEYYYQNREKLYLEAKEEWNKKSENERKNYLALALTEQLNELDKVNNEIRLQHQSGQLIQKEADEENETKGQQKKKTIQKDVKLEQSSIISENENLNQNPPKSKVVHQIKKEQRIKTENQTVQENDDEFLISNEINDNDSQEYKNSVKIQEKIEQDEVEQEQDKQNKKNNRKSNKNVKNLVKKETLSKKKENYSKDHHFEYMKQEEMLLFLRNVEKKHQQQQ